MSDIAEFLSELHRTEITDWEGGYLLKQTETHNIGVIRMLYNWRVVRQPKNLPETLDRAWCFYGTDVSVLLRAVGAALEWDGADDSAPEGWDKNATTGEYSRKAEQYA